MRIRYTPLKLFKAGTNGYLLKQSTADELPLAIETVLKGQTYLTPGITKPVLETVLSPGQRQLKNSLDSLTQRQREAL